MTSVLHILHETAEWFVIDKPAAMHSVAGKSEGSVADVISQLRPDQKNLPDAGLVHRLDYETTRCLVIAKSLDSHSRLCERFRTGQQIQKTYLCIARSGLADQHVQFFFRSRYRSSKKISVFLEGSLEEKGELSLRTLKAASHHSVYEVSLIGPGKRHQIRASFARLNAPLCGDRLYGSTDKFQGVALHSWRVEIDSVRIECPPPEFWNAFFTN